jgi:hypothetical protein
MVLTELWVLIKDVFIYIVKYALPIAALVISGLSFRDSRKANKVRGRLNEVEEKLKNFELEEKEREREEATKACVEARVVKISKGNYKMKVWNSGKATAYNVDFETQPEYEKMVFKEKVPFEFLEPGKSFEEHVLVYMGTPRKFNLTTHWLDSQGKSHFKDQILSV